VFHPWETQGIDSLVMLLSRRRGFNRFPPPNSFIILSHKIQTRRTSSQNNKRSAISSHCLKQNIMQFNIMITAFGMLASSLTNTASAQTMIGLAIATEHPDLHPANACAKQDKMILDEIATALISDDILQDNHNNRHLYTMPATCKYKCRGFLKGTCWYAFPWCWPFRRRSLRTLQTTAHEEPLTDLFVDELEVDHSIDCAKSILAAETKMVALAATLAAGACRDALLEKKIFQCVHLKSMM
jgi:hypothetical protein